MVCRYINHSCAPNCVAEVVTFERGHKIIISSSRRIQKGEEVSVWGFAGCGSVGVVSPFQSTPRFPVLCSDGVGPVSPPVSLTVRLPHAALRTPGPSPWSLLRPHHSGGISSCVWGSRVSVAGSSDVRSASCGLRPRAQEARGAVGRGWGALAPITYSQNEERRCVIFPSACSI